MFTTADALAQGCFFWRALVGVWPIPFEIGEADYAVLDFEKFDVSIVVCKRDYAYNDLRYSVQLWQHASGDVGVVALDVYMDEQLQFLSGATSDMALDEVAAVTALQLLMPGLGGSWSRSQNEMALLEEGEHV